MKAELFPVIWHMFFYPVEKNLVMIKRNISLMTLAIAMALVSCGGNSRSSTTTDSTASSVQPMDSNQNVAPAEGTGDSTMNPGGKASTSTANDSVKRVGGGATSTGRDTGTKKRP